MTGTATFASGGIQFFKRRRIDLRFELVPMQSARGRSLPLAGCALQTARPESLSMVRAARDLLSADR